MNDNKDFLLFYLFIFRVSATLYSFFYSSTNKIYNHHELLLSRQPVTHLWIYISCHSIPTTTKDKMIDLTEDRDVATILNTKTIEELGAISRQCGLAMSSKTKIKLVGEINRAVDTCEYCHTVLSIDIGLKYFASNIWSLISPITGSVIKVSEISLFWISLWLWLMWDNADCPEVSSSIVTIRRRRRKEEK